MHYMNKIEKMIKFSETADIPVFEAVNDLSQKISEIDIYVKSIEDYSLLHTIKSQFYQLILIASEHYLLRKAVMTHNVPYYSNPTKYDIIDNNFEFRDIYSQIQNNLSKLQFQYS